MKKKNVLIVIGILIAGVVFPGACKNIVTSDKTGKSVTKGTDISDLVLIYHGATHRPDWNVNELRPYVYTENETGFQWLFDGYLFLEIFDNIKGYEYDPGFGFKTASKEQWEWLLDRYFGQDKGPDALEAILDSLAEKGKTPIRHRKVVISIPCPAKDFTGWGDIDGKQMDFKKAEDQIAAACWFIDQAMDKWEQKKYKHIQLEGFYWVHEDAVKDYGIIPVVKEYLQKKEMKFYWIPYWKAPKAEQWSSLGFDFAYQQPNYFFSNDIPYPRLDSACQFGQKYEMGMEMEFDENVAKPEIRTRYYDYIKSFEANGVWTSRKVAYYEGGGAWLQMTRSNEPEMKEMVKTLSDIIISRQIKADEKSMKK